ncbi:hypothetical protein GGH19_004517 [Coemansia sp. RSA 1807]|nr:hypothetical protein GGH19_004517 [Coemansia sp. RSA 1807]
MSSLGDINMDDLQNMKRKQLQSLCKKHDIKANGKTEELIERLLEYAQSGTADGEVGTHSEPEDESDDDNVDETDKSSEPEKVFKVMPTTDIEPLDMAAPESINFVSNKEFPSMAERVTAEMEARAAAMAADQRKEVLEKYYAANRDVAETPNKTKQTKAISFDKAHDKIFNDNDSIVNHWAANKAPGTTPRNKRTNGDESAVASNKRPRLEPLFSSPAVTGSPMQSSGQRRKSKKAKVKAKSARARRTAAADFDGATNGSKTVASNTRVKAAGSAALSATKLFADSDSSAGAAKSIEDSAPLAELKTLVAEKVAGSHHAFVNGESSEGKVKGPSEPTPVIIAKTPEAPVEAAKAVTTKVAVSEPIQTDTTKAAAEPRRAEKSAVPTARAIPTKPARASAEKPAAKKSDSLSTKLASAPSKIGGPAAGKSTLAKPTAPKPPTTTRPTLIPKSRMTKPDAAGQLAGPQAKSNGIAKKAPAIPKPASLVGKPAVSKPTQTITASKLPPTRKSTDYSNVQSKLKTYINAKPQPAAKSKSADKPAATVVAKPNTNSSKQPAVSAIPKPVAGKKSSNDSSVPGYMRSTKATEIRSQKQQTKDKSGGPAAASANGSAKARFNPYARSARPAPAKPSAAK